MNKREMCHLLLLQHLLQEWNLHQPLGPLKVVHLLLLGLQSLLEFLAFLLKFLHLALKDFLSSKVQQFLEDRMLHDSPPKQSRTLVILTFVLSI